MDDNKWDLVPLMKPWIASAPEDTGPKMKVADPEQVTLAMVDAIETSQWFVGGHPQLVPHLVRDIYVALSKLGIVMIQPDLS